MAKILTPHSTAFDDHEQFIPALEAYLTLSALKWYASIGKRIPDDEEAALTYMLGKLDSSSVLQQQRRRYTKGEIDVSSDLLDALLQVLPQGARDKDRELYLKHLHIGYETVNERFDARSSKRRGPRVIHDVQLRKIFWNEWQTMGFTPECTSDLVRFCYFVRHAVAARRLDGEYRTSIRNGRAIWWFLKTEKNGLLKDLSVEKWSFMVAFAIRNAAYASQQCEDLFNLRYFIQIGEFVESKCKEKYLLMTNRFMKMHQDRLFWDRSTPQDTNFGEQALIAWNSNIPSFVPDEIHRSDGTLLHNPASEYIDRGFRLDYRPVSFDGKSIEDFLNESLEHSHEAENYKETVMYRTAARADAFLLNGREEDAQKLKNDGLALLFEEQNKNIMGRAVLLHTIGNIEKSLTGTQENNFLKSAMEMYFEIGSMRRVRRTINDMNKKQAK